MTHIITPAPVVDRIDFTNGPDGASVWDAARDGTAVTFIGTRRTTGHANRLVRLRMTPQGVKREDGGGNLIIEAYVINSSDRALEGLVKFLFNGTTRKGHLALTAP